MIRRLLLAVLAAASLSAGCGSGTYPVAHLVKAKFVACAPTGPAALARVSYWQDQIDKNVLTPTPVRMGWREGVNQMVAASPGVLLSVEVSGESQIDKRVVLDKPKEITVRPWVNRSSTQQVFSNEFGSDCAGYVLGDERYFFVAHMGSPDYPPKHLADFLGVPQLFRVPRMLQSYLPNDAQGKL